jgi:DNA polymerase I-like protein with 3'-5' exonuclease and polymerase domains
VLTVHDEILNEMPKRLFPEASQAADAVHKIMVRERPFARGLPISVDASAGPKYFH